MSIPSAVSSSSQLQSSQRAADQAAQTARSLRSQAREARAEADRADNEARSLESKASQAQATATQASLSVQTTTSFNTVQNAEANVYTVLPKLVSLNNQTTGQAAGSVLHTTA